MAEEQIEVETISAKIAAKLFGMTPKEFYELSIDGSVYIREVPERYSLQFREWCRQQPPYIEREWEPWHYIPPTKIVYRLEDVVALYEGIYEREPRLPKPRAKKDGQQVDKVLLTIEQLIAAGKLSETWNQRLSAKDWAALRTFVFERDDYTCQYCGRVGGKLHCDHIQPISQGGSNHPDNLVTACEECNLHKHARTPEEWLS